MLNDPQDDDKCIHSNWPPEMVASSFNAHTCEVEVVVKCSNCGKTTTQWLELDDLEFEEDE
jgi:hypothetical protein